MRIGEETNDVTQVHDEMHDTRQHNSAVRTQHEFFGAVCDALVGSEQVVVTGSSQAQTDFGHNVTAHRSVLLSVLVGWETVNLPTDEELVALATTSFRGHDRMIGEHTLA
ncbi:MAG: hypothetical protein ABIQ10_11630 [Gemmatimonadaceae bacterium]